MGLGQASAFEYSRVSLSIMIFCLYCSNEEGSLLRKRQRALIFNALKKQEGKDTVNNDGTEAKEEEESADKAQPPEDESDSSLEEERNQLDENLVIQAEEVDENLVNIVVREKKYGIHISHKEKFRPIKQRVSTTDQISVFDPYAVNDDCGERYPFVLPRFLGGDGEGDENKENYNVPHFSKMSTCDSSVSPLEGMHLNQPPSGPCQVSSSTGQHRDSVDSNDMPPSTIPLSNKAMSNLRELLEAGSKQTFAIGTQNPLQGIPLKAAIPGSVLYWSAWILCV